MRIFISYGHDDHAEFILRFKSELELAGHETWVDVERIEHGDDWRRQITDGLTRTDAVLAFLSRYSIREPGVCRDELDIARSIPAVTIQTLLLENLDPRDLPGSITHIQWLNVCDWQQRQQRDPADFEHWFQQRFAEVVSKLASHPQYREEIEWLEQRLHPISSAVRIDELMTAGFVGRAWLMQQIERWRLENHRRVLCITGEPGIGKSAIAASIVRSYPAQVAAAHFCQHDQPDSREPRRVIGTLAFQLATRLPDFRRLLIRALQRLEHASPGANPITQLQPAEAFVKLLAEPAQQCIDGERERQIVVIDGLDEANPELTQSLAQHHNKLPAWLGFAVTSRPNEAIQRQYLQALQPIALQSSDTDQQLADAQAYAERSLQALPDLGRARRGILAQAFASASGGNFLYLSMVRRLIEAGQLSSFDVRALPQGLGSLFHAWFRRQFPDAQLYEHAQAPLLRLVAASSMPLPLPLVVKALDTDEETLRRKTLQPLGSLFRVDKNALLPFHPAVREWLRDADQSGEYFVSVTSGRRMLARALWKQLLLHLHRPLELGEFEFEELPQQILGAEVELHQELAPQPEDWDRVRPAALMLAEHAQQSGSDAALAWRRLVATFDERLYSDRQKSVAENLNALGALLGSNGEWREAGARYQLALQLYEQIDGFECQQAAESFNGLGRAWLFLDRPETARGCFAQAMQIIRRLPQSERNDLATYLHNFGQALIDSDPEQAQETLDLAYQLARSVHGETDPITLTCLSDMAFVRWRRGDYDGAENIRNQTLQIMHRTEVRERINAESYCSALDGLARVQRAQGKLEAAAEQFTQLLVYKRRLQGENDPEVARLEFELAQVLIEQRAHREAQPLLEHVLAVCRLAYGDQHEHTTEVMRALASVLQAQGLLRDALPLYQELLRHARARHDFKASSDDEETLPLALVMMLTQERADTDADLVGAWQRWEPVLHVGDQLSTVAQSVLMELMMLCGSKASTQELLRLQLQRLRSKLGDNHKCSWLCERLLTALEP